MSSEQPRTRRKATNVTIDANLLAEARALDINISQTLERALAEEVQRRYQRCWLEDNRAALAAYNEYVAEHGVFSDELRGF